MSNPIIPVPVPIASLDESGKVRGFADFVGPDDDDGPSIDEPAPDEPEEHLSNLAVGTDPLPDDLIADGNTPQE